jgi:RNA-directed DNA polymerase
MLATLERGITGGKWYSLDDKVWKMENLQRAVEKVATGKSPKKADGRKCRRYAEQSAQRLPQLQRMLQEGRSNPNPRNESGPKLGSRRCALRPPVKTEW